MIILIFQALYFLSKFVIRRYIIKDDNSGTCKYLVDHEAIMDKDADIEDNNSKTIKERTNLKRTFSLSCLDDEDSGPDIKFSPPAYVQRYQAVVDVLTDSRYAGKLKKVVDFGCAELSFCIYLKNMDGVQEALFVDIDRSVLDLYKSKIRPLYVDYLHTRTSPFVCHVFEGSVTDHDKSLENCDAVVCIELVEHLYPEPLTMLPFNIFGFIRPQVAVITTPNADFNVLFKRMSGFRHPDHKFEWTRKQFQEWANNIIIRFPEYEVTFHGICNGPPGTEELGACSQMAVFHKQYDLKVEEITSVEGLFNLIEEVEYPYEIDNRTDEQKILDDALYYIRMFSYNDQDLVEEIPLQKLIDAMRNRFVSLNDLKDILQNANWNVVDRDDGPVVLVPPPSTFSDQSFREDDFLENEIPPGYYGDWGEEAGPPVHYSNQDNENWDSNENSRNENWGSNVNSANENWDNVNPTNENWENDVNSTNENRENEAQVTESFIESQSQNVENITGYSDAANSTPSIYSDDVCLDDIETETRSNEFSTIDSSSIVISSFSETKDSQNSDLEKTCSIQTEASSSTQTTVHDVTLEYLTNKPPNISFDKSSSICSMYLEPSEISNNICLENVIDPIEESTIVNTPINKPNKKLKLNNSAFSSDIIGNVFETPKYTSSPNISAFNCQKKKDVKQKSTNSNSSSNEDLIGTNDESKNVYKKTNHFDNSSTCSYVSAIAENNHRKEDSSQISTYGSPEKERHYTGTIPKMLNTKISDTKIRAQRETKLERVTPDTSESSRNSWSPEVMDSGYPNSSSPPDLSPEYDLSSIAHDHASDSESASIADAPRIDFLDVVEPENRDLANNNLDEEGNNMQAEENPHINDLEPLINVLENDLENENDIYVVRNNGFPVWLLGLLQRFDADGVQLHLPMLQPPNENFDE